MLLCRPPGELDSGSVIPDSDPRPLSYKELTGDVEASVEEDPQPSVRGLRDWNEVEDVREKDSSHSELRSESFGGGEEPRWTSRLSERRELE